MDMKNIQPKSKKNKEYIKLMEKIPEDTFIEVPDDNTFYIPISGSFFKNISSTFDYILSNKTEQEIFDTLLKQKSDITKLKTEDISHFDVAVHTLTCLIGECNFQAQEQKKTVIKKDGVIIDSLEEFINQENQEDEEEIKNPNEEIIIKPSED